MAHNVPCPSCGTELTIEVAGAEAIDHRQAWGIVADDLRAGAGVPIASEDLANVPWVDLSQTPEFAIEEARKPRHLERERVVIGWGAHSQALYRWRDELGLPDHLRADARPGDDERPITVGLALEKTAEQKPAGGPTERKYLVEITATYDGGEPISNDDEFAFFVWMQLHGSAEHPSGISRVQPWVRVELDAIQPIELLRHVGAVHVRKIPSGPHVEAVEVIGPRSLVEDFIADNWSEEEAEQVMAELR